MPFHHLSSDDITALHTAAVDAGLTARRGALLGGMDASFATRLDTDPSPSAQLLSDLHALNGVETLTDGSVPLRIWLTNARTLTTSLSQSTLFEHTLAQMESGSQTPSPVDLEAVRRALGRPPGPNPFIIGVPIDRDEDFVGREEQKRRIMDAIDKDQPVQILGEKLMGKTSLLKWVERHALPERPVVWVDPTRGLTPATMVLAIAEALGKREAAAGLARGEATAEEAGRVVDALVPFVLLMDDADALAELGRGFDDGFFGVLRSHAQHRRLTWISASRRNLYDVFKGKGLPSQFLNDAMKVWVGAIEAWAVRELAGRGAAADVDRVIADAGGWGYGVQWLGDFLYRSRDIEAAGDAFASEAEGTFRRWWNGLGVQERRMMKQCLEGVELEGLDRRVRRGLRELVERGFVVEVGERFVVEGVAWREFAGDAE